MKRAVGEEQKNLRKVQILAQAAQILRARDYETLTLSEVASGLDLVKGTLYRYFPTKESLVLGVLEWELDQWLQDLETQIPPGSVYDTKTLAHGLAGVLAKRPLLVKLFSIVHVVLEKNIPLATLIDFKVKTAQVLAQAAQFVESVCPSLHGHGSQAVLALYELSIGIGHLTDRSPLVDQALQAPELSVFRLDFETHLSQSLTWTLAGMTMEPT